MIDWSIGTYERTAAALDGVSTAVVAQAGVQPGDRVLDIACGTGNAALKAAARGAAVTGVDLASRLVLVAQQRARAAGLDARFVVGDAQELPVADASADVLLSVFGVIFAPDAARVAAEIARVLVPGGRALVAAWVREGALAEAGAAIARALAPATEQATAPAPGHPPANWSDPGVVLQLFAAHGVTIDTVEATVAFRAASPEAWEADQVEHHPLWISAREQLGDDAFRQLDRRLVDILHAANEDPAAFRVTSRYTVTTIARA